MSAWSWILIWALIVLGSLLYLGYLGYDLLNKAKRAAKALEAAAKPVDALMGALEKQADLPIFQGNLLDEPAPLVAELVRLRKKRAAKRLERQRRLINKLIDYNESEFKP